MRVVFAAACFLAVVLACAPKVPAVSEPAINRDALSDPEQAAEPPEVSTSFADEAVRHAVRPDPRIAEGLRSHPAVAALVRHRHLSGDLAATPDGVLGDAVNGVVDPQGAQAVVDVWRSKPAELAAAASASEAMLPAASHFDGTIYFIVGYDIAVASPPDILVNADHPHFREAPSEVSHYVTHEAHHVGFLAVRPSPELSGLTDPQHLRDLIRFMTQMEGMAVHAAYEPRRASSQLDGDPDYRIYDEPEFADQVRERYREAWERVQGSDPIPAADVGEILSAMSSGQRLWYRFGALVAWTVDQEHGRQQLVASIAEPDIFWDEARRLLRPGPPQAPGSKQTSQTRPPVVE